MTAANLNLKRMATTTYDLSLNSMVRFGDKYIGASSAGLHKLGKPADSVEEVKASMTLFSTDFGVSNNKKLRKMYFVYESDQDFEIDIVADEDPKMTRKYVVKSRKKGIQRQAIPVGNKMKGVSWSFTLSNLSGGDLSLYTIHALVNVLHDGRH